MGKITNKGEAFGSCICYKIDPQGEINPRNLQCYSKGVKGVLRAAQTQKCRLLHIKPASQDLIESRKKMNQVTSMLKSCFSQSSLEDFDNCLMEHLK